MKLSDKRTGEWGEEGGRSGQQKDASELRGKGGKRREKEATTVLGLREQVRGSNLGSDVMMTGQKAQPSCVRPSWAETGSKEEIVG